MNSATIKGDEFSSSTSVHQCRLFSLEEIQSATKNFNEEVVIGQGGFGKVYRGQISNEETDYLVAIKRLDIMSNQGAPEFRAEIEMLSKLRHCHLVSLIGYCDDNKEMILVYEYIPHGTLYHHLHNADTHLNWVQRLKISIGAGRGLDYLHTGVGTQHGIIHRDVKSSNILLDENWAALISDFGLSKISPTNQSTSYIDASVKGTFGYMDPAYFYTRKLTRKTDVYAFGVVLFELLSGRLAVDENYSEDQYCSLVRWAQTCMKARKLDQLVDPKIRGTIFPKCLRRFVKIAERCVYSSPKERPSMTEVVASLQALLELQQNSDNFGESSGIVAGVMGLSLKIHMYLVSKTKLKFEQSDTSSPKSLDGECSHRNGEFVEGDVKMFTFKELKLATRNFENETCLGFGTNGTVYKGWVDKTTYSPCNYDSGLPIAVKILHRQKIFDLEKLKEFRHTNLVKLIGYCLEDDQLSLVYEFMHKGNLNDLLRIGAIAQLELVTKVKIVVGIARGIVFLNETQNKVEEDPWAVTITKSRLDRRNILLDEDFSAKLSGYDVTKLVYGHYPRNTRVDNHLDTHNYWPGQRPFLLQSNLSGFTVVFAEVLTGKKIYDKNKFEKIDGLFCKGGNMSLILTAKLCFEICNEVNSESKMLTILKKYETYIPK